MAEKKETPIGKITDPAFVTPDSLCCNATIDGILTAFRAHKNEPIWKAILDREIKVKAYSLPDMTMNELKQYRNEQLDLIDKTKTPTDLWDDMSADLKQKWKKCKKDLRDLPKKVKLAGIKRGDKEAALKLMPKQPT